MTDGSIRAATYNIHAWIGGDSVYDPERVLGVVREMDADIVALQEVTLPLEDGTTVETLGSRLGMTAISGITMHRDAAAYGNLLLSRLPVSRIRLHDISVERVEPRGVIEAVIDTPTGPLTILATHLGLKRKERRTQSAMIANIIGDIDTERILLMGDLNDWLPGSPSIRALTRVLDPAPPVRTFPAKFPLVPLDRGMCRGLGSISASPFLSAASIAASDHLPLTFTCS